jgi:hypothetical protein
MSCYRCFSVRSATCALFIQRSFSAASDSYVYAEGLLEVALPRSALTLYGRGGVGAQAFFTSKSNLERLEGVDEASALRVHQSALA